MMSANNSDTSDGQRYIRRAVSTESVCADESVNHIFCYGTLRADFKRKSNGSTQDNWGIVDETCNWFYGTVQGFNLYQDKKFFYPFAVQNQDPTEGVLVGTVISWDDEDVFQSKLELCDEVEEYDGSNTGLYNRSIVEVTGDNGQSVNAYIYYQSGERVIPDAADVVSIPRGDWLRQDCQDLAVDNFKCPDQAVDSSDASEERADSTETSEELSEELSESESDVGQLSMYVKHKLKRAASTYESSDDEDDSFSDDNPAVLYRFLSTRQKALLKSIHHEKATSMFESPTTRKLRLAIAKLLEGEECQ